MISYQTGGADTPYPRIPYILIKYIYISYQNSSQIALRKCINNVDANMSIDGIKYIQKIIFPTYINELLILYQ